MKKFLLNKGNLFAFIAGIIPSLVIYFLPFGSQIPAVFLLLIIFILAVCIWVIFIQSNQLKEIKPIPALTVIECSNNLCFCKNNGTVVFHSLVILVKQNHLNEEIIGFGIVQNITDHNVVQIEVIPYGQLQQLDELLTYINDNRKFITVKPTITLDILHLIND